MIERVEQEIMQNWKGDIDNPMVSVCCITYNHEQYVAEALDSFLMQETDFPFEVIVRDDASPDKTADMIREYEKKYPNIIKPIYEKENGYQKGIKPMPITFKKAKGEYIALCEGDDYWTDTRKLQIQVDEMKKHPEVDMSFHISSQMLPNGKKGKLIANYNKKIFSTSDVIVGDGGFCSTNSLMLKNNVIKNLPDWFYTLAPVGDLYLQILGSMRAGALCIPKNMSDYRVNAIGSWTSQTNSFDKMNELTNKSIIAMDAMNDFLEKKYSNDINYLKSKTYYKLAVYSLCNNLLEEFEKNISKAYKLNPCFNRVRILYFLRNSNIALKIFKKIKRYR